MKTPTYTLPVKFAFLIVQVFMFSTQSFSQEKGGFSEDMRPETIS